MNLFLNINSNHLDPKTIDGGSYNHGFVVTNASQYSIPTLRSLSQIKSNALSFLFYI